MSPSGYGEPGPTAFRKEEAEACSHAFVTTRWGAVLAAGRTSDPGVSAALEELCRAYWFPLYAYVRRRGYDAHTAEDLTQEFFRRLLEKHWLAVADPAKGRFRTFLLNALSRFLANEWDAANAQKRGGGKVHLSLDQTDAEGRYQVEPHHEMSPEKLYEKHWAEALLASVLERLSTEFKAEGAAQRFEELKVFLMNAAPPSYAETAARLGMSESALKSAIFRLRRRFAELLRDEIGKTVTGPGEVEDELKYLLAALS